LFTQSPEKQALIRHLPSGTDTVVFNGQLGWISAPGRAVREMHGAEIEIARMDADLQFPLHIQEMFPELRTEYPERIEDREVSVLFAVRESLCVRLYFDKQTGLLVRSVRYADSALGLNPSQVDYADYRAVDGLQVPFRLTISQPGNSSTIQFEEIHQNGPIDATRFAKLPTNHHSAASASPN
jgi:photosynthetic reaction center cytochrome c subunit